MPDCPAPSNLKAFLLDELSEEAGQAIDSHVATCDQCEAEMARLCEELAAGDDPEFDFATMDQAEGASELPISAAEVNRFRELYSHAKGGLGEVFVAHDQQLDRNVALKRMQDRHARNQLSRIRFELEAEVTGKLEHPGIVPVYARGADEEGRPFYAMRFIRGKTLKEDIQEFHDAFPDTWQIREARLKLQELLRRLIDICNAIEYAHHRGVLHRDLKPANIMLGKFGETMVVDWGLAKTSESNHEQIDVTQGEEPILQLSGGTASGPTTMGTVVGTIGYMSPEQASGRPEEVSSASDIYSLGAILYRLVTGKSSQSTGGDKLAILKRIEQGDFPRPREIKPQIPRPLESICLRAMESVAANRYSSARAMARDIESWIADERVAAHSEGLLEKSIRLARRHRNLVAATIGLLLVSAAISVAILGVRDARRSERQASQFHRQVRNVTDVWLTGAAEDLSEFPQAKGLRKELLGTAIQQLKQLEEGAPTSEELPSLEIERGLTFFRTGELEFELGRFEDAKQSFESARLVFADNHDTVENKVRLAQTLMKLGGLTADQHDDPEADFNQALTIYESLVAQNPNDAYLADAFGSSLSEVGRWHLNKSELKEAEEKLSRAVKEQRHAIQISNSIADMEPTDRDYLQQGLCYSLRDLGDALLRQPARVQASQAYLQEALQISGRLKQRHRDERVYVELHSDSKSYYANVLRKSEQLDRERELRQEVTEEYEELILKHPFVLRYQESVARATMNLAHTHFLLGNLVEAKPLAKSAEASFGALALRENSLPRYRLQLAAALDLRAQILSGDEQHTKAQTHAENAAGILAEQTDSSESSDHRHRRANNLRTCAIILRQLGKTNESMQRIRQSISLLEQLNANDAYDQYVADLNKSKQLLSD